MFCGPLSRCARICNASAQGGQILTSWEVIRKAIKRWAPDAVLQAPEEGQEPVLIPALYCARPRDDLSRISHRCACSDQSELQTCTGARCKLVREGQEPVLVPALYCAWLRNTLGRIPGRCT